MTLVIFVDDILAQLGLVLTLAMQDKCVHIVIGDQGWGQKQNQQTQGEQPLVKELNDNKTIYIKYPAKRMLDVLTRGANASHG
jgi:hypothetical protein